MIDVPAGYQKLCGQDALDYVRYRHLDNDLVRAARQQSFLREAKDQIGVERRVRRPRAAAAHLRALACAPTSAARSAILQPAQARGRVLEQADPGGPVPGPGHRATAPATSRSPTPRCGARCGASSTSAAAAGARGTTERTSAGSSGAQRAASARAGAPARSSLGAARRAWSPTAARARTRPRALQVKLSRLPVYFPRADGAGGRYRTDDARAYDIVDRAGRRHRAYRIVAYEGSTASTTVSRARRWSSPPILDDPSERAPLGRAHATSCSTTAARLRIVAWRTPRGVYWVSNTLLRTLTNRQMLALARSATRIGA